MSSPSLALPPKIHIVLHQTKQPGNIGAVGRVMGNMGADRLILVDPLCSIDDESRAMAVGCQHYLENHAHYANWQDFYASENDGLRLAFSARDGKERPAELASQLFSEIWKKQETEEDSTEAHHYDHIYLFFGREDFGLSANDLLLAHHVCQLETFGSYKSLNLAQAVLLALYQLRRSLPASGPQEKPTDSSPEALSTSIPMKSLSESLESWLEALGFDLSSPRTNAFLTLNAMISRLRPTPKELKVFEAVLQQTVRKLTSKDR